MRPLTFSTARRTTSPGPRRRTPASRGRRQRRAPRGPARPARAGPGPNGRSPTPAPVGERVPHRHRRSPIQRRDIVRDVAALAASGVGASSTGLAARPAHVGRSLLAPGAHPGSPRRAPAGTLLPVLVQELRRRRIRELPVVGAVVLRGTRTSHEAASEDGGRRAPATSPGPRRRPRPRSSS